MENYSENFTCIVSNVTDISTVNLSEEKNSLLRTVNDQEAHRGEIILKWKEVFSRMGAKPKYCSSLESLKKAFDEAGRLYEINPIVDFYNAYSLCKGIPMAAYDQDKIVGRLTLRSARKDEDFVALGNPKQIEKTKINEIIYADDERVICRYWNLQDSHETRITEGTSKVLFVFDIMASKVFRVSVQFERIKSDFIRLFGDSISCGLTGPGVGTTA